MMSFTVASGRIVEVAAVVDPDRQGNSTCQASPGGPLGSGRDFTQELR
jgi:hypothetical protein